MVQIATCETHEKSTHKCFHWNFKKEVERRYWEKNWVKQYPTEVDQQIAVTSLLHVWYFRAHFSTDYISGECQGNRDKCVSDKSSVV